MEGNIVQAIWFKFWKPKGMTLPPVKLALSNGEYFEIEAEELPEKYDSEIQSWDCTFKDNKTSDYVCGGLWKRRLSNYYLIDCYHKQASFTDTIEAIKQMTRTYPGAIAKYIEDRANGTAVISSLKSQISGIIAVDATDDKIARLNAVTPVFQSGNVYLPHPKLNSWTEDMIKELLDFPNGAHDDFVDMLSQALNKLMYDNHNTDTRTVPKGTWAYQILKERGYSDLDILGAYKNGDIKLYMIPDKLKKRFAKWG
jgi:predicted phage terminase large subunit-like protein